jgi:hypothetical protein
MNNREQHVFTSPYLERRAHRAYTPDRPMLEKPGTCYTKIGGQRIMFYNRPTMGTVPLLEHVMSHTDLIGRWHSQAQDDNAPTLPLQIASNNSAPHRPLKGAHTHAFFFFD